LPDFYQIGLRIVQAAQPRFVSGFFLGGARTPLKSVKDSHRKPDKPESDMNSGSKFI